MSAEPRRRRPFSLLVIWLSLSLLPNLLLAAFVRPPAGLVWWAAHALVGCLLLGALMFEFDNGRNPRLAQALPRLALPAIAATALLVVLQPEQVLGFLLETDESYTTARVIGAVVLAACAVLGVRAVPALAGPLRGAPLLRALAATGAMPTGGGGAAGARRRLRAAELEASGPFTERLRGAIVHRTGLLARCLALGGLTLVTGIILAALTDAAFVEAWVALLLVWVLMIETRLVRWRSQALTEIDEPDPDAGRPLYEAWWGLSAGWVLVFTTSATARMGGLRPQPWLAYLGLLVGSWLLARWVWHRVRRDPDAVMRAWFERRPGRLDELRRLEAGWPRSRRAEFGHLP